MTDHFVKDFIFDDEQVETLKNKYQEVFPRLSRAGIYSSERGSYFGDHRNCYNVSFQHREFPDISLELLKLVGEIAPENLLEDLWFAQFEFIRYEGLGQQFGRHNDDAIGGTIHNRFYTSVTMIEKSKDLSGGKLKIWTPSQKEYIIDLDPFETIIFPAHYDHEATPILKGRRVVLISWAQRGK